MNDIFERRHYEHLAQLLRYAHTAAIYRYEPPLVALILYIADDMARTQGNFKRDVFLKACGVDEHLSG